MLYKYPQREFPYARLVEENRRRGKDQPEFELLDTGIFDDDRYFDVFVEYAKAGPDDILMRVTVHNRGPEAAAIARAAAALVSQHLVLEQFRQTEPLPARRTRGRSRPDMLHWAITRCIATASRNFCSAKTKPMSAGFSALRPCRRVISRTPFTNIIVHGNRSAVNPDLEGTKAGVLYQLTVPAGGSQQIRLRLACSSRAGSVRSVQSEPTHVGGYGSICRFRCHLRPAHPRSRRILRRFAEGHCRRRRAAGPAPGLCRHDLEQAILPLRRAGMAAAATRPNRRRRRNASTAATRIGNISTTPTSFPCPTSGNIPWYAAWDLAFHCRRAGAGGRRVCQAPARAAHPRMVHAPERPVARLRMGVRRREPARARLGRVARVPD